MSTIFDEWSRADLGAPHLEERSLGGTERGSFVLPGAAASLGNRSRRGSRLAEEAQALVTNFSGFASNAFGQSGQQK